MTDTRNEAPLLAGSSVCITGGTGSFGSTMARHVLRQGIERLVILSRDEAKQDNLRRELADARVRYMIGDVRDFNSVATAVRGVDFVFHAAALKQVPSCEFFPDQAVRTNVQGSFNVINASAQAGVRSVVCLSTDKAVYPVNAMGMSKALMEKTAQAFARNNPDSGTTVTLTRYGNVMYSRGSVIPLFIEQLRQGKPLTITEPGMTRFLMSLENSVELVDYAFLHAQPGDLFVQKAPACTVETLARAVATLLGDDDPEIRHIGMRHGEKMHESLLGSEEMVTAIDEGDYYRVPLDARGLEYQLYFDEGTESDKEPVGFRSDNTELLDVARTVELLRTLPEFHKMETAR